MKIRLYFIVIILVSFLCSAGAPSLNFQKNDYQPQETIIGEMRGIESLITRNDIHIYDGRREILFEKNIVFFNNTHYIYFIPTKEGVFDLKINNLLYKENDILKSFNIDKKFNIKKILIDGNKTKIVGIQPGIYVGNSPTIFLTNYGNDFLEIIYENENITLNPGDSKKMNVIKKDGFSYAKIKTYSEFSIPTIYNTLDEATNNTANDTKQNESNSIYLIVPQNITVTMSKNESNEHFIEIFNGGNVDLKNIEIKSSIDFLKIDDVDLIEINENKKIILVLSNTKEGIYSGKIEFYLNNSILDETNITILVFKNYSEENIFKNIYDAGALPTCAAGGGKFCTDQEECVGETPDCGLYECWTYNPSESLKPCCLVECKKINEDSGSSNQMIFIGIIILVIVAGSIYFFYKQSNRIKSQSTQDKFSEIEKKNK